MDFLESVKNKSNGAVNTIRLNLKDGFHLQKEDLVFLSTLNLVYFIFFPPPFSTPPNITKLQHFNTKNFWPLLLTFLSLHTHKQPINQLLYLSKDLNTITVLLKYLLPDYSRHDELAKVPLMCVLCGSVVIFYLTFFTCLCLAIFSAVILQTKNFLFFSPPHQRSC